MYTLLIILLIASIGCNVYLMVSQQVNRTRERQAKTVDAHSRLVRTLRAEIAALTEENTGLIAQNSELSNTVGNLKAEVERLSKAAGFVGKVTETTQKIGNGLKQVTVPNAGTVAGKVAGNVVKGVVGIGKAFKQAADNAKAGYEAVVPPKQA